MKRHPLWRSREFLEGEALLDDAIDARGLAPVRADARVVLLTGATGFIGGRLLARLLDGPLERVYVVLRAASPEHARERLAERGLDSPRVVALVGELGAARLGLTPQTWDELAESVDAIFHFGADARWTASYEALAASDVGSTRALLELATTRRLKRLDFAGSVASWASLAVEQGTVLREDALLERCETLPGGYCQTKWVCEAMLREAVARGLAVAVHRLGDVKGHSQTGLGNLDDFGYSLLRACMDAGVAPALDYTTRYLPVDLVVDTILALARVGAVGVFQRESPAPTAWADVVELMREAGRTIRVVSPSEWLEHLRSPHASPQLRALRPVFRPFASADRSTKLSFIDVGARLYSLRHDERRTFAALGDALPRVDPSAASDLLPRYLEAAATR